MERAVETISRNGSKTIAADLLKRFVVTPMHRCLRGILLLRAAVFSAIDHDVFTVGQATAYSSILALFPALIVTAAVVGMLPGTAPLRSQLAGFFDRVLPSNVAPLLDAYFSQSHQNPQTTKALFSALVVSLFGAANVMSTLMEGFRRAHGLPEIHGSFWPRRMRALVLVPLSLLPMAGASLLVMFGHFLTVKLAGWVATDLRGTFYVIAVLLRWTVALTGSVAILGLIYHLGTDPDRRLELRLEPLIRETLRRPLSLLRMEWTWRASLPGAALATGLWFISTLIFGLYVTRYANYSRVYGSLGAAIALLVWLYIIAVSVLMGAEFNAQRARDSRNAAEGRPSFTGHPRELLAALRWPPGWRRSRSNARGAGRMSDG
ncbi:membrane protein [Bryocella elongata]|uniref:Membrane protein n=1 Tax=Bryocella elongata TaxID=863522 RepID=A0A1H6BXR0_9BACT|nr:YihY/virulence factor BrkB family protein [Bryocella elongata]SEG64956.1 membrane protein [Bryocella elongata]